MFELVLILTEFGGHGGENRAGILTSTGSVKRLKNKNDIKIGAQTGNSFETPFLLTYQYFF